MLAKTPPMGWNSWNTFGPDINAAVVCETADKIVELGLKDCGYEYVVIDDIWMMPERDENDRLVPNPEKFPDGMKAVADYVHSKGLKFGIYSCAGIMTCAKFPSSFQYEFIDAQTFAEWGVDFLKYDFCFKTESVQGHNLYKRMAMALRSCGREILFNACNWGAAESFKPAYDTPIKLPKGYAVNEVIGPEKWMRSAGIHMWRSTGDINDSWASIVDIFNQQDSMEAYGAPGCYNDMDMLVVGMNGAGNVANGGCSLTEYKTHFSLWAMMNSPLFIGADLSKLDEDNLAILKNKDIIAINQDEEGREPYKLKSWASQNACTLVRPLANGDYAIGAFNLEDNDSDVIASVFDMGLPVESGFAFELHELWEDKDYGRVWDIFKVPVKAHDCKVFRAKFVKRK